MNAKQKIEALGEKMSALQAEMRTLGEAAIVEAYSELFAANTLVDAVQWTQYAPSFNDGEPCEFSVHELHARVAGTEPSEDEDEDDEEFVDSWSVQYDSKNSPGRYPEGLEKQIKAFEAFHDSIPEDIHRNAFGDGQKVTVYRDGKVENDYYGDY